MYLRVVVRIERVSFSYGGVITPPRTREILTGGSFLHGDHNHRRTIGQLRHYFNSFWILYLGVFPQNTPHAHISPMGGILRNKIPSGRYFEEILCM